MARLPTPLADALRRIAEADGGRFTRFNPFFVDQVNGPVLVDPPIEGHEALQRGTMLALADRDLIRIEPAPSSSAEFGPFRLTSRGYELAARSHRESDAPAGESGFGDFSWERVRPVLVAVVEQWERQGARVAVSTSQLVERFEDQYSSSFVLRALDVLADAEWLRGEFETGTDGPIEVEPTQRALNEIRGWPREEVGPRPGSGVSAVEATRDSMQKDAFLSHASEDKDEIGRPLFLELQGRGLNIWFDEFELTIGDSLSGSIDSGLAASRYGIVILSPSFLGKPWPERELQGLVAKSMAGGEKVILPVWHGVGASEIAAVHPPLADLVGVSTERGIQAMADALVNAMRRAEAPTLPRSPAPHQDVRSPRVPALRAEAIKALRAKDPIGLQELLRTERFAFEANVRETLVEAAERAGNRADPETMKPVEAALWAHTERRLGTLLPLVEYDVANLQREFRHLAAFAGMETGTSSPYSAWRSGHRLTVWWLCWTAGAVAIAGEHLSAANALWATAERNDSDAPLPALRQLGAAELASALSVARFDKTLALDGLWHLAFNVAQSALIAESYPELLRGVHVDGPLSFLGHAGDWAFLMALLSTRRGPHVEIPKYWHASQVNSFLGSKLEGDMQFAADLAGALLDGDTGADVRDHARAWAESAPGPSNYL